MALTGKLVHYGTDLLLVSALLAGIRHNTGLQLDLDRWNVGGNNDGDWQPVAKKYVGKYLNWGESLYDYTVATLDRSNWFKRK